MTAIVGLFCKDGAVIGADSSATFTAGQIRTIEQLTHKIDVIEDRVILAGTGPVGLTQRVCAVVKRIFDQNGFTGSEIEVSKRICREALEDFKHTYISPQGYGFLAAFPIEKKHHLCEFAVDNLQPEFKTSNIWYCSIGGGQLITDPFLGFMRKVFWNEGLPNVQEGVFAVNWTLQHAIEINPGGVNGPVKIAVLERVKDRMQARILESSELQQHNEHMDEAITYLRDYRRKHQPSAAPPEQEIPKP
jgi:20S proteasome alpha/beta subunit